jgi:hypothetical protein
MQSVEILGAEVGIGECWFCEQRIAVSVHGR